MTLDRFKGNIETLINELKEHETVLSNTYLSELKSLYEEVISTSKVAKAIAQEELKKNSYLEGVGSNEWKIMFDAAREYSEQFAYKDRHFPFIGGNSRCVLCQQELSEEAKERFIGFDKYIKSNIEKKLREAQEKFDRKVKEFKKHNLKEYKVENQLLGDITDENSKIAEQLNNYIYFINNRSQQTELVQ